MESGSLIDLDDHQQDAHAQQSVDKPVYEVSLSGHGLEGLPAGSSAVTADSTLHNADPFAGLEAMAPIQASDSAYNDVVTPDPASAAQQGHVQNSQLHHEPVQHSQQHTQDSSSAVSLKAAAERAAHTSDVLQRHSIEQGECNAKLRLLLATVAAKQVKARKMLADLSSDFSTALTDSQSSSLQQVQDLNTQLQQAYQQVAAAQADAEQQRQAAAQQADLAHLRDKELHELRAELKALRKAESRLRAELRDREARLLEAQAALSQLTAELPGSRQLAGLTLGSMSEDGSTAVDSSVVSTSAADADAGDTADSGTPAGGALPLTPVGSTQKGSRKGQAGLGAGVGGSMGGALNLMTPDQAAAAQYKALLGQAQSALLEAQDIVMAREETIKQLKQQLRQQQGDEQQQDDGEQQLQQQDDDEQQIQQQQEHPQQEQQLLELQAAVDAAAAAAAAAGAERDELASNLDNLKSELMQLKLQLAAADADRSQAEAALKALQQQQHQHLLLQQQLQQGTQKQQQDQPDVDAGAAAASAAERAAAAEQELHKALAAAAEASAEVASLQKQLKQLQEQQQQQPGAQLGSHSADAKAAANGSDGAMADPCTTADADAAGPGGSLELLQANCRIHVLQEELQDTQDSMRLLLLLIKKSAASAADAASGAAAGTLSAIEHEQLQRMLSAECKDTATPAGGSDAAGSGAKAAAEARFELGLLHGLLHKLDSRYCPPKPLQDVLLRGKELEHMLAAALQRVHGIKAEAGGGPCACPTEQDYQQPYKVVPAPLGDTQQPGAAAAGAGMAAGMHAQHHHQQQLHQQLHQQQQQGLLQGYAVIDAAAAAAAGAGPADGYDSNGWLQGGTTGDGYGVISESSLSGGGYSGSGYASASGGWDSWAGHGSSGDGGHAAAAGAAAVRGFSTSSGPGAAAGGAGVAGGDVGGLAPLQDENMGYDGLDGAWWATSNIDKPLTEDDLPDFLLKK